MIQINIGCHLSASKGYLAMGQDALSIKANTFAFFTRNPRGGSAKKPNMEDIAAFMNLYSENNFAPLVAHSPYTLNACSADPSIRDFARRIMAEDLKIMEYTPNCFYNFHPGSHVKQGVEIGIDFIVRMLNEVLSPGQTTTVLLETMAGKGSEIGKTFEELRVIIDRVNLSEKIGVCLDTCHIWDGGYDIVGNLDGVLEDFDRVIGLDRLKAIHLNDSMNHLGIHKDRHACIGEGKIGFDAFVRIINHPSLKNLPFILETPNDLQGYAKEIERLKQAYIR